MTARLPVNLETVWVDVSEDAVEAYEAALSTACDTVGFFLDEETGRWRIEGVKPVAVKNAELTGALSLAALASGETAELQRAATEAEGWLARTQAAFPEQRIGRRFAIRGSHMAPAGGRVAGRIVLVLDAGVAFGSGEHGSTRGCLRALERVAHRRPARVLDLGTGSGILGIAASRLLRRRVRATDIDPWSVRSARANARANRARLRVSRCDGWRQRPLRGGGRYDLVLANILARPLARMAPALAAHLAPGGTAILAGLLYTHVPLVLAAHRRAGLALERRLEERPWTTLVLRRRA